MKELVEETPAPVEGEAAPAAETDAAAAPPKKKRYTRVPLTVDAVYANGYSAAQISSFVSREAAIADQDRFLRETRDKRNELEAYIYDMRNKLGDSLASYATDADRTMLMDRLNGAESWLYGEGFDEKKEVYQMHLDQLKAFGDPIAARAHEASYRQEAAKTVRQHIEMFMKVVVSTVCSL